ncbi:MAG TPA: hypothetical protein VGX76_12275 [Pirellulales bacterium]|jgi:hypothetical protein|nr:hypothetical protein [Pirellulales bacterium]
MAISFNGIPIPGIHGALEKGLRQIHAQRTHFAGLWGDSEITLGSGSREITCKIWLNDPSFGSSQALVNFMQFLDDLVETNGIIQETGTVQDLLPDCTFEGFQENPEGMHPAQGQGMNAGTWWIEGTLRWRQLSGF